jgi:hypothetical protein
MRKGDVSADCIAGFVGWMVSHAGIGCVVEGDLEDGGGAGWSGWLGMGGHFAWRFMAS